MMGVLLLAAMLAAPPDGRDCAAIEGTEYRSDAERAYYWQACIGRPLAPPTPLLEPSTPISTVVLPDVLLRIRECESGGNYQAYNPAGYYGAFQFDLQTWASVGGVGNPMYASPAEQDLRALLLYAARGTQPWGCAG